MKINTIENRTWDSSFVRLALTTVAFVAANLLLVRLTHLLGGPAAGQTLLPIYFFTLLGGIMFGWQAGLMIGVLTPIISYVSSGMPMMPILTFVLIKSIVFGVAGGILAIKFGKQFYLATLLAIIIGELLGFTYIWLSTGKSALALMDLTVGYVGLLLQFMLIPVLARLWDKNADQASR